MNETKVADARLNIKINANTKNEAEFIFQKLGMNMTTGVTVLLTSVVQNKGIPFPLVLGRKELISEKAFNLETDMNASIQEDVADAKAKGQPMAYYDSVQKRAYLEYPDGRRVYAEK